VGRVVVGNDVHPHEKTALNILVADHYKIVVAVCV
jgi:hypothetical protein